MKLTKKEKEVFFEICKQYHDSDCIFTVSEIAGEVGLSKPTARKHIKSLVKKGLLEKKPKVKGERENYYGLTEYSHFTFADILSERQREGEWEDEDELYALALLKIEQSDQNLLEVEEVLDEIGSIDDEEIKNLKKTKKEILDARESLCEADEILYEAKN